jgi:hypothetical protein
MALRTSGQEIKDIHRMTNLTERRFHPMAGDDLFHRQRCCLKA